MIVLAVFDVRKYLCMDVSVFCIIVVFRSSYLPPHRSYVIQYRLHEFDRQIAAIRRGLATIVPLALLVRGVVCVVI